MHEVILMARIGMLTFLHNENYGSILQAWALQQVLLDLGHDARHIDYAPSRREKLFNLLRSGNSPRLILEGLRKKSAVRKMHSGFDDFRAKHLWLTSPCPDHAALTGAAADFELLLCGSDQIWSPLWLNPAYFLDFTDRPKVAYAPSLGVSALPGRVKQRRIAHLVKRFSAVSVREAEGAALLRQMAGIDADVLPDPVMLLPRERWQTLMDTDPPAAPYVLCYFIGENPQYWVTVRQAAERAKCGVLVIPRTEGARAAGYPLEEDVPPQRWLTLLGHAAHVVTDSFHGATFCAILNTPCTIVRRDREDDPQSKNSRIDQLLRTLNVESLESPDWAAINQRLTDGGAVARAWLTEAISKAKP